MGRSVLSGRSRPRLPLQPLYNFCNSDHYNTIARMVNIDARNIRRFQVEGSITIDYAERIADGLGIHPTSIWGNEYTKASVDAPITKGGPKRIKPAWIPEKDLLEQVRTLAKYNGWLTYHTHNSTRSEAGFPDLVLVRPPTCLVVELKSAKGKLTEDQRVWMEALEASGIDVRLWRPSDMDEIVTVLRRQREERSA